MPGADWFGFERLSVSNNAHFLGWTCACICVSSRNDFLYRSMQAHSYAPETILLRVIQVGGHLSIPAESGVCNSGGKETDHVTH